MIYIIKSAESKQEITRTKDLKKFLTDKGLGVAYNNANIYYVRTNNEKER